jgi:hypothetical protein
VEGRAIGQVGFGDSVPAGRRHRRTVGEGALADDLAGSKSLMAVIRDDAFRRPVADAEVGLAFEIATPQAGGAGFGIVGFDEAAFAVGS